MFSFPIERETDSSLSFRAESVLLGLRKRKRNYDGRGGGSESPGLQLAFKVSRVAMAVAKIVVILCSIIMRRPTNPISCGPFRL